MYQWFLKRPWTPGSPLEPFSVCVGVHTIFIKLVRLFALLTLISLEGTVEFPEAMGHGDILTLKVNAYVLMYFCVF